MNRLLSTEELAELRESIQATRNPDDTVITVCGGTGCRASGALELSEALAAAIGAAGHDAKVQVKLSGCHGFCQQGPVVVIDPHGIFYKHVGIKDLEADVNEIVERTIGAGEVIERLIYTNPDTGKAIGHHEDIPFYAKQTRVVLSNNGKIDPNSIEDYIAAGGYSALAKALTTDPDDIIGAISASGLRGRGGGGFPTGTKWKFCRNAKDRSMRHIICNADEGDPGAFMDRSIMEGDPLSVLEGMTIGALAMSQGICDTHGHIYIRAEYPLAVQNVRIAIQKAEELGLLGDNILGTDFSFHIKIKEGAGAFVCGEETAMIASIEGKRGMPRTRPPFPANQGLFGQPSNINNVETWANIPHIIDRGADWFAGLGTETSKGTKVFSLVGKVKNSGLVEVPMGMPLREIVFDIGGGVLDNKAVKAVQTGGPSGGCISADMLDIPVDYDKLAEVGAIMGSGGLVVMDEDTCMVDLARYFIEFTQSESCGKCAPCRLGTRQMLNILTRIVEGNGQEGDVELLGELGEAVKKGSLCGLGQTAPNPVLTTIRYFREEYDEHINNKCCPAGQCTSMLSFNIDEEKCVGCTACSRKCPVDAIAGEKKSAHTIDQQICIKCGACYDVCKFDAVDRA